MPDRNKQHFRSLEIVLEELHSISKSFWDKRLDLHGKELHDDTLDDFENLNRIMYQMTLQQLKNQFKNASGTLHLDFNSPFYLPPLDRREKFVPILTLKCNLGVSPPQTSMRIGMLRYAKKIGKAQGFGFRFELGESEPHDYYHFQITSKPFTTGFRNRIIWMNVKNEFANQLPGCPDWLPEICPCIPVPANCPVTLLLCVIFSFYGKKGFGLLTSKASIKREYLNSFTYLELFRDQN